MKKTLLIIFMVLIIPVSFVYGVFTAGFIIHKLWDWFIYPLWPTMGHLKVLEAAGISLLLGYLYNHPFPQSMFLDDKKLSKKYTKEDYASVLLGPWIILFCGWIIKHMI